MLATWGSVFHFSWVASVSVFFQPGTGRSFTLYFGCPKRDNHEKQSGIHRSFSGSIVISIPAPRSCVITFSMIRSIQGTSRYIDYGQCWVLMPKVCQIFFIIEDRCA